MKMMNTSVNPNDVNEAASHTSDRVASVRDPMGEHRGPDHISASARQSWTKEVNKLLMRCFYFSEPKKRGYRKRMHARWREIGVFERSEQQICCQARAIRINGWLSDVELKELEKEEERRRNRTEMEI